MKMNETDWNAGPTLELEAVFHTSIDSHRLVDEMSRVFSVESVASNRCMISVQGLDQALPVIINVFNESLSSNRAWIGIPSTAAPLRDVRWPPGPGYMFTPQVATCALALGAIGFMLSKRFAVQLAAIGCEDLSLPMNYRSRSGIYIERSLIDPAWRYDIGRDWIRFML
jgi:hypothetical protein